MKFNWKKQNGLKYSKNDKSSTLPRHPDLNRALIYKVEPVQW